MKMRAKLRMIYFLTGTLFLISTISPAIGAESITLKFADWQVLSAFTTKVGAKPFIEKITELSSGNIKIEYFPAEQLGKGSEMLTLLETGVADIANIAPAYISDRFPLSGVSELPGMVVDSCASSNALYELSQPGGILYENEYKNNNVRLIFAANLGPYRILTTKQKIESLQNLKGLNIRTAGGAMDITTTLLGANSIRMQGSDVLPSLTRGTLDGVLWGLPSIVDWSLEKQLHYMTPNLSMGSFVVTYCISEKSWQKLSKDQQNILIKAGKYATISHCDYVKNAEANALVDLQKKYGIQPTLLQKVDLDKANEVFVTVFKQWGDNFDSKGKPGSKVLELFRKTSKTE